MKITYATLTDAQRDAICAKYREWAYLATDAVHAAAIVANSLFPTRGAKGAADAYAACLTTLVHRQVFAVRAAESVGAA